VTKLQRVTPGDVRVGVRGDSTEDGG
jgi:hypothetical protein